MNDNIRPRTVEERLDALESEARELRVQVREAKRETFQPEAVRGLMRALDWWLERNPNTELAMHALRVRASERR